MVLKCIISNSHFFKLRAKVEIFILKIICNYSKIIIKIIKSL